jgi:hypothetical protein
MSSSVVGINPTHNYSFRERKAHQLSPSKTHKTRRRRRRTKTKAQPKQLRFQDQAIVSQQETSANSVNSTEQTTQSNAALNETSLVENMQIEIYDPNTNEQLSNESNSLKKTEIQTPSSKQEIAESTSQRNRNSEEMRDNSCCTSIRFECGWITKKGDRDENQDSYYAISDTKSSALTWAVFDG